MFQWMNRKLDKISEYLSSRKGLLPLVGIGLIIFNFVLQFFVTGWVVDFNLFLHLGLVVAIFGLLLSWAL
jgi:hypothetical protein